MFLHFLNKKVKKGHRTVMNLQMTHHTAWQAKEYVMIKKTIKMTMNQFKGDVI